MNTEERTSTPLRAVLLDFGGVFAEEGFREGLYAIARHNALDPAAFYRAAQEAVYETGYVTGRGTEADFWRALRGRFGFGGSDAELTREILERFRVRPRMRLAVRALRRAGLTCGLLSDQTDWLDRLDARGWIFEEFDRLYISYRLGKGKEDPTLFEDVVADLGVEPQAALFIDDSPGNVRRAVSGGLNAIQCAAEADCLAQLRAFLKSRGLELELP